MQRLTKELMVAYFYIGRTNLERVYSKLVNKGSNQIKVGGEKEEELDATNIVMARDSNLFLNRARS